MKFLNNTKRMMGRSLFWRMLSCLEEGVLLGGRYLAWRKVSCLAEGVLYGGRCLAWRKVSCLAKGVGGKSGKPEEFCRLGTKAVCVQAVHNKKCLNGALYPDNGFND